MKNYRINTYWAIFYKITGLCFSKKYQDQERQRKSEELSPFIEEIWQADVIPAHIILIKIMCNGTYSNQGERNSPEYYQVYGNGVKFDSNEMNILFSLTKAIRKVKKRLFCGN